LFISLVLLRYLGPNQPSSHSGAHPQRNIYGTLRALRDGRKSTMMLTSQDHRDPSVRPQRTHSLTSRLCLRPAPGVDGADFTYGNPNTSSPLAQSFENVTQGSDRPLRDDLTRCHCSWAFQKVLECTLSAQSEQGSAITYTIIP